MHRLADLGELLKAMIGLANQLFGGFAFQVVFVSGWVEHEASQHHVAIVQLSECNGRGISVI